MSTEQLLIDILQTVIQLEDEVNVFECMLENEGYTPKLYKTLQESRAELKAYKKIAKKIKNYI